MASASQYASFARGIKYYSSKIKELGNFMNCRIKVSGLSKALFIYVDWSYYCAHYKTPESFIVN
jgi:hypothetical protein